MTAKLPDALVETRPALAEDPSTQHPTNGAPLGPVPARYTRALHDAIVQHIADGNRPTVAAKMAGLPESTFYSWMQRGRNNDPHLWEFARDIELAEGRAEGEAVKVIKEAFKDDPDHAKWWLERARARGWNKSAAAIADAQIEEFMRRLEAGLPPEVFQLVLSVAVGQQAGPALPVPEVARLTVEEDT